MNRRQRTSLDKRLRKVRELRGNPSVKVGLPAATVGHVAYPNGMSVIRVGTIHEFGLGPHTEKAWLRGAIQANRRKYQDLNRINLRKIALGTMSVETALGLLGAFAKGHVQQRIISIGLVDTGRLAQSVSWHVSTARTEKAEAA